MLLMKVFAKLGADRSGPVAYFAVLIALSSLAYFALERPAREFVAKHVAR